MTHLMEFPGHELLLPDVVRAKGSHLFDAAGNQYLDLEAGVWCMGLGHGRPEIAAILQERFLQMAHAGFNYSSAVVEDAAAELLALHKMEGGRCAFLCSGSEAVEYSVRVARMAMDRPLILTFADSYFGAYGSAALKNPDEWHAFDWFACQDCPPERSCDQDCPQFSAIPFERVGAFLLEPGSSGGLVRFAPQKLVKAIEARMRESDGLVMVNEVTTGLGRTGEWFGYMHYGISPDTAAMGKGLGNGYPVSAAVFSPAVIQRLGGHEVHYAQSHMNDPLGAAVAREVIRIIDAENLLQACREKSARLLNGLGKIRQEAGRIKQIRGRGLMIAVELQDNSAATATTRLQKELFSQGYLVAKRPGLAVLRLDPCLTVEPKDLDGFLEAMAGLLSNL